MSDGNNYQGKLGLLGVDRLLVLYVAGPSSSRPMYAVSKHL